MKLSSLSEAYSTSDNQVETFASEDTTRSLEQNSTLCQSAQAQDQELKPQESRGPDEPEPEN